MAAFLMTLEEMSRLALLLLLGFALRKLGVIPAGASKALSRMVAMVFLPAMNLYSNMVECKIDSLRAYGSWVLYGAALVILSAMIATVLARFFSKDEYEQGLFRYSLAVPNTGAVATPLMLALYGTAGVYHFNLLQFVQVLVTYSWGVAQLLPNKGKPSVWSGLRKCINVNSIAMVSGIVLGLLGAAEWMPDAVIDTVSDLAGCYVALTLLLTGATIAEYPMNRVFGDLRGYVYSLLRLVVLPCFLLLLLIAVDAPKMVCIMAALAYASPSGANVVVYPTAYGKDCSAGVSMVLISCIGAVVTVPLIYALVQNLVP